MNKRIQELMAEVGMSVDYLTNTKQIVLIEKFAELIVRECARVADQWVDDEDNGHNLVSTKLRQHFGVE